MDKQTRKERAAARAAHTAKLEAVKAGVRAIVATGRCPECGGELRRNLSLTGWWQCEQLGAESHRKDPSKPSCRWQGFTE